MTTLNNLKKSDVLNAAIVVSKELSANAEAMAIKFNERLSAGMDTKKDNCLLYTSPSPRDLSTSRMPSSA